MLRKFITLTIALLIAIIGLIIINNSMSYLSEYLGYDLHGNDFFGVSASEIILGVLGLFIFLWLALVLSPFLSDYILSYAERMTAMLSKTPTSDILVIIFGIGIGLIIANLMGSPFARLPIIGPFIPIILSLILSVIGAKLALRKHNDIVSFFTRLPMRKGARKTEQFVKDGPLGDRLYSSNKLLDTSVIIDGRVMDIVAAGFLEGQLVIPNFVLQELQRLSDSADSMKRAKGRRGLDLVQDLQLSYGNQIIVVDNDFDDIAEVDAKLVRLAKQADCLIMTNDYNLNKVAEIQGVGVLNINELANAIKPMVMAGESMSVYLVKEGREIGQAVAYLEDGTMIVVEGGRRFIGTTVNVIVSSVLQTAAGRMIFAKISR